MRKNRKYLAVMVLGFALAGAVLTGCGGDPQPRQDTRQDTPANISEENGQAAVTEKTGTAETESAQTDAAENIQTGGTETPAPSSGGYEDNFAVDSKAAEEYAEKIRDAVARKDLEALADLTAFPVYVGLPDVDVVETREDFLKLGAEAIFTDELLESIEAADIEHFEPCMAGFPISGGEGMPAINFGVTDGELAINGINY